MKNSAHEVLKLRYGKKCTFVNVILAKQTNGLRYRDLQQPQSFYHTYLVFCRYISLARTSTRLLGTIRRELFLTRGCRTQCFNPDHFMLVHNLQIQTFPPFVIFVLPRIDLRLHQKIFCAINGGESTKLHQTNIAFTVPDTKLLLYKTMCY